jgi:hypothetical protein
LDEVIEPSIAARNACLRYTERLVEADNVGSVVSRGDSFDDAPGLWVSGLRPAEAATGAATVRIPRLPHKVHWFPQPARHPPTAQVRRESPPDRSLSAPQERFLRPLCHTTTKAQWGRLGSTTVAHPAVTCSSQK